MGPTVWMTRFTRRLPAVVETADFLPIPSTNTPLQQAISHQFPTKRAKMTLERGRDEGNHQAGRRQDGGQLGNRLRRRQGTGRETDAQVRDTPARDDEAPGAGGTYPTAGGAAGGHGAAGSGAADRRLLVEGLAGAPAAARRVEGSRALYGDRSPAPDPFPREDRRGETPADAGGGGLGGGDGERAEGWQRRPV